MPLKTPEEKKNAIKWVVQQLKVFGITFVAALGTVWGIAEIYLEDYVRETATEVIEERQGNKSFREVLGDEMGIPTDIVPYYITGKLNELDSLILHVESFEKKYIPKLEFHNSIIPLYKYVDKVTGQEYKFMPDDRSHPVMIDENSIKWIIYGNRRVNVKDL